MLLVLYGKKILYVQASFRRGFEVSGFAINGSEPLKLWFTKTWPQFIRANIKWLTIRKAPHKSFAKITSR
jgi:hypothetical protein